MKYTYRWGQKPLEGFTIKRGLGQGGFGEVYFAISDGGKEVALKWIRGQTDIRGSITCLNLKHPNLVHLYDLRRDGQGDCWLVMEYIHGETLASLLARNPEGLPEQQARQWFLQMAEAVAYLHDHAIIHRDIKPLNLFVEQGAIKLGDYGLSKSITSTQGGHTSNAGSILYMAPEISSGNYTKQIDIYACGVVFYEMLTGDVPFKGESWAEIAMRHQMDDADLSKIPDAYKEIFRKALHKNAAQRYRHLEDMIADVKAVGRSPATAAPVAGPPASSPRNIPFGPAREPDQALATGTQSRPNRSLGRGKLRELAPSMACVPLFAIPGTIAWAAYHRSLELNVTGPLFLVSVAIAWLVLATAKWREGSGRAPGRMAMTLFGAMLGLGVFWLDGWSFYDVEWPLRFGLGETHSPGAHKRDATRAALGYAVFFALALGALRWWRNTDRKREEAFSFFPVIVAAIWGGLLLLFGKWLPVPKAYAVLALASAAGAIQIVSPWMPPPPPVPRRLRLTHSA